MEQETRAFLNKFIASLSLKGVKVIPFAGDEFQSGITTLEKSLKARLLPDEFNKISEAFVKVPVEETYQEIRNMFMTLNGDGISFAGVDNPQWRKMTITRNPYLAQRILMDLSICDISSSLMDDLTKEFCEAVGISIWEEF